MRRYTLQAHRILQMLRVRARGTRCYVVAEGMDTAPAKPREFLNVQAALDAFAEVAPEGWEPVVEEVPVRLGIYGTGAIARDHVENPPSTD